MQQLYCFYSLLLYTLYLLPFILIFESIIVMQNYDEIYKIILAGDANVGKTNIVYRFIKPNTENNKNIAPTVGVQFSSKSVLLPQGKSIKVQIWDTAGQQQYRAITNAHYRKAQGALVVFDMTNETTFKSIRRWIQSIRQYATENVVIVLVGNKADLKSSQVVTTAEGRRLAKELGVFYEETSAITGDNIQQCFRLMLEQIYKRKKQQAPLKNESKVLHLKQPELSTESKQCQC